MNRFRDSAPDARAPRTGPADLGALHLALLDWPELLARLSARAQSSLGQQACLSLPLAATRPEAEARLADVSEAATLVRAGAALPSLAFPDIELHLDAVEKGAALGAEELRQVATFCQVVDGARRAFARLTEEPGGPQAPRLCELAQELGQHDHLVAQASETFDAAGEIRDSASPDLMRLRRERDGLAGRAREQAEAVLHSEEYAPYLQDEYVTLREDRFVLPLRASFKSMGLGIVHDTSRSGETVFVEPARLVEVNNRLKVVEIEIRRECRRILEELAAAVAGAAPELRTDRDLLTRLDVIVAAARLGVAYGGNVVPVDEAPVVDLRGLRHPLLALRAEATERERSDRVGNRRATGRPSTGPDVVGNDVALGQVPERSAARVLVVSGPNAGGKTVLLKAVGLAALLARAGLLVPAAAGSRIGFFEAVLADIGDQQSVTGDLSTFSAHLANIAAILEVAGGVAPEGHEPRLLVLLDELMSGTHPEQGAALARATLEALGQGQALVLATTHYDSLKSLTDGDGRFRNAGMEYDLENLKPTFRLKDGLPGRSYALDIATRMGLPQAVLARAQDLVGQTSLGLEEVLRNLEAREEALVRSLQALEDARQELELRAGDQKAAAQALSKRERELGVRAHEVLDAAVREAREAINDVVKEVRRARTPEAAQAGRRALDQKREEIAQQLPARPALDIDKLKQALATRALGGPTDKPAKSAWGQGSGGGKGAGKANNPSSGSSSAASGGGRAGGASGGAKRPDEPGIVFQSHWNTLDLRGQRADAAVAQVEEFLDKAVLDAMDSVIIIHGHGTGALRKVVRELLATSRYVERFRPGGAGEGGDGVSVVTVRG